MNALAKQDFSREQIDLIKQTVARGATDNELKLFLYAAHRTGLDPLTKQIYFIKRRVWNPEKNGYDMVGTIQTGIDGYRVVAARNGLAGIDDVIFDSEDKQHPNKATVSVYRMVGDTRVSFTASARWSEYVQVNNKNVPIAMWKKMPYLMLGKVAEALALRKAFPADLSGVYTSEEMDQAEEEAPQSRQIEPPNKTAEALVDIASKEPEYTRPEQLADEIAASKKPIATDKPFDWKSFGEVLLKSYSETGAFTPEQHAMLDRMKAEKPKSHANLMKAIEKAKTQEPPQPKPEDDPDAYRMWFIDQLSRLETSGDLDKFFQAQRPLWQPCFPPDIEDWETLVKERAEQLG